jgi:hypothetical protein
MKYFVSFFFIALLLYSCKRDNNSSSEESRYSISGYAQKGPFPQGSKVTVYELNNNLEQTGKVFTTETSDDFGSFTFKDMLLTSSYVQVEVEGNPYNEIYNAIVIGDDIDLSNIVNLKEGVAVNINLLSDLSRQRFQYLFKKGNSFDNSKSQAEKEVMKAFGLDSFYTANSEKMDITQSDDASGALLSLSAIFLTIRNQQNKMFLQQLIAKYRSALETDGILSDTALSNPIRDALVSIDPETIRSYLSEYYGKEITSFAKFIDIAKQKLLVTPNSLSPGDIVISDVTGNLLALKRDTNYLPDSIYSINFSWPKSTYKDVRLTLANINTLRFSLTSGYWQYISGDNNHMIYEMKGIGLSEQGDFRNRTQDVFYILLEDITSSPEKIVAQKWIGFNYH